MTPLASFFAGIGVGCLLTIIVGWLLLRAYRKGVCAAAEQTYLRGGRSWPSTTIG